MGYVSGQSRGQAALFPVVLDDLVPEDHAVRVIDAFVAGLDLAGLGFAKAEPAATGRPPYDPGDLLRLYLYGYLNQVRSSRRLERECGRNVEVMWLLNRLVPDHKTIAEFRRLNASPFKAVCRGFVRFCAEAKLIGGQWVAIDGSKFQAVASKRAVVTAAKLEEQLKAIDRQVQGYLESLDAADAAEGDAASGTDKRAVREALAKLKERRADVASTKAILAELDESQHVVGEPEAKLMKTGQGASMVAYNVQTAVDAKNKLVVHHELTNEANDQRSLLPMALGAREAIKAEALNVVADAGYSNGQQAKQCEEAGITPYVPVQRAVNNTGEGIYFDRSAFAYDKGSDSFRCPAGETLKRKTIQTEARLVLYTTSACGGCALKAQCTGARQRWVTRHFEEEALERMHERLVRYPQAMALRRESAEHPFANLKHRILGDGRLLMRGLRGASGEMALAVLAYNFRRALNLLGANTMRRRLLIQPA
jgi:transposase